MTDTPETAALETFVTDPAESAPPLGTVGPRAERDPQTGRWTRGNRAALVVGARSLAFWTAADDARREIREAVIADAGFAVADASTRAPAAALARSSWPFGPWSIVSLPPRAAQRTPFRREGVAVIEVKALPGRSRRLIGDEETRLLKAADPYTTDLLIAALETGCRGGELRSLQWAAVRAREIVIEPEKSKTRRARAIPITQRLRAVLELRKHAPDGTELPPEAYVFGNAVGEPVAKERAGELWREACKAAGIVDLHFHDLRREFACRLMESGASAHETRDALGHSNLTMTNHYLSTSGVGLARAFDRFERARTTGDASFTNLSRSDASESHAADHHAAKSFVS